MCAYGRSPPLDIPRKRSAPSLTLWKGNVERWWIGGRPVPAASARNTPSSIWWTSSRTQRVLRSTHHSQKEKRAAPWRTGAGEVVLMRRNLGLLRPRRTTSRRLKSAVKPPPYRSIPDLFFARVAATPDASAFLHPEELSLIHISEPTRLGMISYAVFCLK